jgi:oxygen-independent coproporphyrinogen-3 oxidase
MMSKRQDGPPGLYIHVPFCSGKCPYCDFYSVEIAGPGESAGLIRRWLSALESECERYRDDFAPFETLYVGGGTPSRLPGEALAELLRLALTRFPFERGAEVTLEANPEDVTGPKIELALGLGVNRVSLGVQSLDDAELHFLGRRHTAGDAARAARSIRDAGCSNLCLDLMYGLPGQTEARWLQTLKAALAFEPEHLSCYQLSLASGTPFARLREEGRVALPDEEEARALFLLTSRFLEENGYIHYEISNFARGESFFSRHNRKYWSHAPYLGLGPAAHSFRDGTRWWNVRSLREYCDSLAEGGLPIEGREALSADQIELEAVYLGLRTRRGVAVEKLRPQNRGRETAERLCRDGLATLDEGRLALTREGFVVADAIVREVTDS